jgi:hypothetical protein
MAPRARGGWLLAHEGRGWESSGFAMFIVGLEEAGSVQPAVSVCKVRRGERPGIGVRRTCHFGTNREEMDMGLLCVVVTVVMTG